MSKGLLALLGVATAIVAALVLFPDSPELPAHSTGDPPALPVSETTQLVAPGNTPGGRTVAIESRLRDVTRDASQTAPTSGLAFDDQRTPAPWAGMVLQANGSPARDAWLEVRCKDKTFEPFRVVAEAATGRFTLPALAGKPYLAAYAPGQFPRRVTGLGDLTANEPIQLWLRGPGATLRLHILDDEGQPIPGASVTATEDDASARFQAVGFERPDARLVAESDAQGDVRFDDLLPAAHTVKVSAPGHERALLDCSLPITSLNVEEEQYVEVRLTRGAVLMGRVTSHTGAPLENCRVSGQGGAGKIFATSDPDGRYELRGLALAQQEIRAHAASRVAPSAQTTVVLDGNRVERWDPVLSPQQDLVGQLVNHEGKPIVGWSIRAHTDDVTLFHSHATTDSSGEFTLVGVPESEYFISTQPGVGYDQSQPLGLFREFPRDGTEVRFVLPESAMDLGRARGRVLYPDGQPASSVRVFTSRISDGQATVVSLQPDGRFEVARHLAGEYELGFLQVEGHGPRVGSRTLRFQPGTEVDLGEIVLERTGTLVIDPSNPKYPVEHGDTRTMSLPGSLRWNLTRTAIGTEKPSGTHIEWPVKGPIALPPGEYTITLRASHFRAEPVRVTVRSGEESRAQIPLQTATEVRFTFVAEDGSALTGDIDVRILHGSTQSELRRVTAHGSETLVLDLEPIPKGRTISATATDENGVKLKGGLRGYLTGGMRSNHDFTIQLRPQ